jgi:undecaprenyl-diphosphatase
MDHSLQQLINGPAGSLPALDEFMKFTAGAAEFVFLALVAGWFVAGVLGRRRSDRYGAIGAFVAAGGALGVNQVIALLWSRPRPFVGHPAVHVLVSRSVDPSFPSDHAAAAFAIATVALLVRRRLGLVTLALAAVVAYGRVYVGVHYPGDVVGGAVAGILIAALLLYPLRAIPATLTTAGDGVLRCLHLLPR